MNTKNKSRVTLLRAILCTIAALLFGCATIAPPIEDGLEIVDCEIPGNVLRIGTAYSMTGRSHALRTSGSDCAIRGES
jgi:hypothetical protein